MPLTGSGREGEYLCPEPGDDPHPRHTSRPRGRTGGDIALDLARWTLRAPSSISVPVLHLLNSRRRAIVPLLLALLLAAGACRDARTDGAERAPRTAELRDDYGHVERLAAPPRRIVSLNPATTEILFALGAGPRVVGRTQYDLWPDSARLVPSVGAGMQPNLEAVLGRAPDLVVMYASGSDRGAADRLTAAGVPTAAFRMDHIADFGRVTLFLGRLLGDTDRARIVVDSVTATLARVRDATQALPRPTVFLHAWEKPLMTIGGGSFLSELVTIAGARNIYDSLAAPSPVVTLEDVLRRNPDIILVSPVERGNMMRSDRWRALPAVRNGRVLAYDTNLVARPAVKLGEAAVSLARLFHPGVLP
jgi:iron complex transport system substrate-binding protein